MHNFRPGTTMTRAEGGGARKGAAGREGLEATALGPRVAVGSLLVRNATSSWGIWWGMWWP